MSEPTCANFTQKNQIVVRTNAAAARAGLKPIQFREQKARPANNKATTNPSGLMAASTAIVADGAQTTPWPKPDVANTASCPGLQHLRLISRSPQRSGRRATEGRSPTCGNTGHRLNASSAACRNNRQQQMRMHLAAGINGVGAGIVVGVIMHER